MEFKGFGSVKEAGEVLHRAIRAYREKYKKE
jgi:hypothetical protein